MTDTPRDGDAERLAELEAFFTERAGPDANDRETYGPFLLRMVRERDAALHDAQSNRDYWFDEAKAMDAALREARAEIERLKLDAEDLHKCNQALAAADEELARLRAVQPAPGASDLGAAKQLVAGWAQTGVRSEQEWMESIAAALAAAREQEREECLRIVRYFYPSGANKIIDAIRARSRKEEG